MKLLLRRDPPKVTCHIGELLVNGEPFAWALEDLKHPKVGKGCIPAATYSVILSHSPAAKRGQLWSPFDKDHEFAFHLPLIVNVPDREGIRLHAATTEKDLIGCIGVGIWTGGEYISKSRDTLEKLCDLMVAAKLMKQSVTIEINDPEAE